jgi:hypothetical protein
MNEASGDHDRGIHLPPTPFERRLNRGLERTASLLTSLVAVLLIIFVLVALAGTVHAALGPLLHGRDYIEAAVEGVDGAFLAIILLELVHTTLSRGPLARQLQELLVVGITSAVRTGLEVNASRAGGQEVGAISLAVNAGAVLILAAAFWLIRHRVGHARA